MSALSNLVGRLERIKALDVVATPLQGLIGKAVRPRRVRNVLSGTALGHALHPMLTDVPIGAWSMSAVLDAFGGRDAESAADILVLTGIVAAVPTAASGLHDWSDTYGPETRIGLVHGGANVAALALYVGSLVARHTGHRDRGQRLGLAGLVALLAGGYLGGHLSFVKGVNVNHTAFEHGAEDWTPVLAQSELGEGEHRKVFAGDAPVLLCRENGLLLALANTCTHAGGPLDEGEVAAGCVTCPWHGSIFRLTDGKVVRGPASTTQPVYDTRVQDGQIEVRARG